MSRPQEDKLRKEIDDKKQRLDDVEKRGTNFLEQMFRANEVKISDCDDHLKSIDAEFDPKIKRKEKRFDEQEIAYDASSELVAKYAAKLKPKKLVGSGQLTKEQVIEHLTPTDEEAAEALGLTMPNPMKLKALGILKPFVLVLTAIFYAVGFGALVGGLDYLGGRVSFEPIKFLAAAAIAIVGVFGFGPWIEGQWKAFGISLASLKKGRGLPVGAWLSLALLIPLATLEAYALNRLVNSRIGEELGTNVPLPILFVFGFFMCGAYVLLHAQLGRDRGYVEKGEPRIETYKSEELERRLDSKEASELLTEIGLRDTAAENMRKLEEEIADLKREKDRLRSDWVEKRTELMENAPLDKTDWPMELQDEHAKLEEEIEKLQTKLVEVKRQYDDREHANDGGEAA